MAATAWPAANLAALGCRLISWGRRTKSLSRRWDCWLAAPLVMARNVAAEWRLCLQLAPAWPAGPPFAGSLHLRNSPLCLPPCCLCCCADGTRQERHLRVGGCERCLRAAAGCSTGAAGGQPQRCAEQVRQVPPHHSAGAASPLLAGSLLLVCMPARAPTAAGCGLPPSPYPACCCQSVRAKG